MAIRKYRKKMPGSLEAIKRMGEAELQELWGCYFSGGVPLAKPLWYKIMCEQSSVAIEQRHVTRLNTYAKTPDAYIAKSYKQKYHLKPGSQIEKTFKGKQHLVMVCPDGRFRYNAKYYKTLSAVAFDICGHKVSGNDFFGLNNKNGGLVNDEQN
ncbi:MAG: DUF2924 domain-containing protein [Alphaproteobacteria bacterium]|nr:DUF2924 domain-containing protein [Alphaproteobacteria bacterium]